MLTTPENIYDIAKAIQLALGPVFLLTGIAAMLNVMTGRLSRIIERARALTEGKVVSTIRNQSELDEELKRLTRRGHLTSNAITMCTIAALLVCLVIIILFIQVMLGAPLHWIIGVLFMFSTIALVIGLSYFLREVHISARTIRNVITKGG
jgi:uncharacterized membrane protein